jgi:hypothetical protein
MVEERVKDDVADKPPPGLTTWDEEDEMADFWAEVDATTKAAEGQKVAQAAAQQVMEEVVEAGAAAPPAPRTCPPAAAMDSGTADAATSDSASAGGASGGASGGADGPVHGGTSTADLPSTSYENMHPSDVLRPSPVPLEELTRLSEIALPERTVNASLGRLTWPAPLSVAAECGPPVALSCASHRHPTPSHRHRVPSHRIAPRPIETRPIASHRNPPHPS